MIDLSAFQSTPGLLAIAGVLAVVGAGVGLLIESRSGVRGAGPLMLFAATPLVPAVSIALGLSLDDVLPLVGLLIGLPLLLRPRLRWPEAVLARRAVQLIVAGFIVTIVAALASAVFNASDATSFVRLALRGAGRLALLGAIVVVAAGAARNVVGQRLAAYAMTAIGTSEAVFGLVAYFIGLPDHAGLSLARKSSVLFGEVPGRITGTLGISSNFIGAIFIVTTLVTAGLALGARDVRQRLVAWLAVFLQLAALTLTYSRVSLGLTVIGLGLLVVLRSRARLLVPIGVLLGAVALFTPTLARLFGDAPDRLALWSSAVLLMIDHPLFGVGSGQFLSAAAANPDRYVHTGFGTASSTAHNSILLAGAETGIPGAIGATLVVAGLGVLAVWCAVTAWRARRDLRLAAGLALGAFLAQSMFNNLFTVGVTSVAVALLLGSQVWPAALSEERGPPALPRPEALAEPISGGTT